MQLSNLLVAVMALLSASMVMASPMPCNPKILDLILNGEMPKSACCSYGVCIGDVNVSGG